MIEWRNTGATKWWEEREDHKVILQGPWWLRLKEKEIDEYGILKRMVSDKEVWSVIRK